MRNFLRLTLSGVLFFLSLAVPLTATQEVENTALSAQPTPDEIYYRVGIDQNLGTQLPLDLPFRDEQGNNVKLKDYFGQRPAVLVFVYYRCSMLCPLVLNGLVKALRVLSFDAGKQFDVIAVSFNPKDTPEQASAKKEEYLKIYKRSSDGWHFLTADQTTIQKMTEAGGFKYVADKQAEQFAHASGILVLTPGGRIARYFYGIEYAPKDLRLALVEASQGKIGSLADKLMLLCFHYDPVSGKYGFAIIGFLRLLASATAIILGGYIFYMIRRESVARTR